MEQRRANGAMVLRGADKNQWCQWLAWSRDELIVLHGADTNHWCQWCCVEQRQTNGVNGVTWSRDELYYNEANWGS